MSTITLPHQIGSEPYFAAVCAELVRQGIRFEARDEGDKYIIELQGF